jgi:NADPH:quinone reductase-like Zn-dependent oxidoreductase
MPIINLGSCAEFVKFPEQYIALKLTSLSFKEAASISLGGYERLSGFKEI